MLEVIATCIDDVQKIVEGGGQRIELVSGLTEGGLTPSRGLIQAAVRRAGDVPVRVMIRPHARSFVYSTEDLKIMREDIEIAQHCGAAGLVLGALTPKGEVDRRALEFLLAAVAPGRAVTFHRALDAAADPVSAFEDLLDYPAVVTALTSGGPAAIMDNLPLLKRFAALGKGKIKVLAGGGVKLNNARAIMEAAGVEEIHVGTAVRKEASCLEPIDPLLVGQFRRLANPEA